MYSYTESRDAFGSLIASALAGSNTTAMAGPKRQPNKVLDTDAVMPDSFELRQPV
jgi:hypothetical protein